MSKDSKQSRNKLVQALHDMNDEELQETLENFQGEMFHEEGIRGMGYAMGRESNYAKYRNLKRDIARIKTEIHARELNK